MYLQFIANQIIVGFQCKYQSTFHIELNDNYIRFVIEFIGGVNKFIIKRRSVQNHQCTCKK